MAMLAVLSAALLSGASASLCKSTTQVGMTSPVDLTGVSKVSFVGVKPALSYFTSATGSPYAVIKGYSSAITMTTVDGVWTVEATSCAVPEPGSSDGAAALLRNKWVNGAATLAASAALFSRATPATKALVTGLSLAAGASAHEEMCDNVVEIEMYTSSGELPVEQLEYMMADGAGNFQFNPIGSITAHIAEAQDCARTEGCVVMDGASGDVDYPFMDIKVLMTVGEYDKKTGFMLVGVPDGMGCYLKDDSTVRVIWQSESYGPLSSTKDSFPFVVNPATGASFTGSHVMYVDYDRTALSNFMAGTASAEHMVLGAGDLIKTAHNLKGDVITKRVTTGDCCSEHAHFSDTDKNGCGCWSSIMNKPEPSRADWLLQSLCSAHLEEKHQWGVGIGVEDDLFITNEEWTTYKDKALFTGIPAHVIELSSGHMWATGAFTLGGFEKIVEINCGNKDYVCFSPSGYNGNFGTSDASLKQADGPRPDGSPYVWPKDIVPSRIYIGKKGFDAKGMPSTSFLARNGLAFGQLYGFATDVDVTTAGLYGDAFHAEASGNLPGAKVVGGFYPLDWQWDGEVKDFKDDGCWAYQHKTADGFYFWTSAGPDMNGFKKEHNTPDPYGGARYIQGSTAGYFGIYDFTGITAILDAAAGAFPTMVPATYTMLEGERDITAQINLGGKGLQVGDRDATQNYDSAQEPGMGKKTFEDVDGLDWYATADSTDGYLLIQEDSGNRAGERTFMTKIQTDGTLQEYFLIALSGGSINTRNSATGMVGVPAKTNAGLGNGHEFSGSFDLSGVLARDAAGNFIASSGNGMSKRAADMSATINDKTIAFGLQAHSLSAGIINTFSGDRGGQIYIGKPKLPVA
eukprot:CAMPEP_0184243318 /NCGR_PEP_ID=MMETSP0977-20130417/156_1 /TAXON_ID=483370 /ORGANISM="non described non described, Strain CCMP2097" /LENGTH=857 /DNA_ID=CAMNT_0026548577 /DNA_START=90 /DNA_END=2663 /DNA_ORIENTATION=-